MCDDKRPTLTLSEPKRGENDSLSQILIGMDDYYSGLDEDSFHVTADFEIDGVAASKDLSPKFKSLSDGVFALPIKQTIKSLSKGTITVSVKDRQGNVTRIERTFSIKP